MTVGVTPGAESIVPKLFQRIQALIERGDYVIGEHAVERLEERGIMEWHVVAAMAEVDVYSERPRAKPNPAIEAQIFLPDGTECKAVWSLLRQSGVAKLVTVHFFDEEWQ